MVNSPRSMAATKACSYTSHFSSPSAPDWCSISWRLSLSVISDCLFVCLFFQIFDLVRTWCRVPDIDEVYPAPPWMWSRQCRDTRWFRSLTWFCLFPYCYPIWQKRWWLMRYLHWQSGVDQSASSFSLRYCTMGGKSAISIIAEIEHQSVVREKSKHDYIFSTLPFLQ